MTPKGRYTYWDLVAIDAMVCALILATSLIVLEWRIRRREARKP